MSLYEDSTRRPERTRARERRVGCRPVPTGQSATTSRVTATERRARRAHVRAVRRRRRFVAFACVGIVAALIGRLAVPGGREAHAVSSRAAVTARARVAEPLFPGPFHGYLLIADRGNNRMLLVDGAKRVLWRYPRRTPGMPFRFDDDTFFGSTPNRIISNQEDQHTIQVIAFPSGRILWRYGHTNVRGGAPGYLNTPDDAYLLRNGLVSVADARGHEQFGSAGVRSPDAPRRRGCRPCAATFRPGRRNDRPSRQPRRRLRRHDPALRDLPHLRRRPFRPRRPAAGRPALSSRLGRRTATCSSRVVSPPVGPPRPCTGSTRGLYTYRRSGSFRSRRPTQWRSQSVRGSKCSEDRPRFRRASTPTPSPSNRGATASTTRTAPWSAEGRASFSVATSPGVPWAPSGRSERGNGLAVLRWVADAVA